MSVRATKGKTDQGSQALKSLQKVSAVVTAGRRFHEGSHEQETRQKESGLPLPDKKRGTGQNRCSLSEILAVLIGHDRRGPHG